MKIAVIFPGYSSQFVGMAKDLYDEHRVMQEYFEEAYNCLNLNFIKLCFASSDSELSKPSNAFPSILLVSAALAKLLEENDIKPDVVSGYGIGHYSAIFTAGGLTFPDALYLIRKLASFYEESLPSLDFDIIRVTGIASLKLKKILSTFETVQIAAYNSVDEHLVSGKSNELDEVKEVLKTNKIKFFKFDKEFGLNSGSMQSIADLFKLYMEKVDFKDISIPVVSTIDGKEIFNSKKIRDFIIKQISTPIKWNKVVEKISDADLIIQVGPGNNLKELLKESYPDKQVMAFNNKNDLDEIKQFINLNKQVQNEPQEIKNEELNVQ